MSPVWAGCCVQAHFWFLRERVYLVPARVQMSLFRICGTKTGRSKAPLTRNCDGRRIAASETDVEVPMQLTPPGQSLVADRLGIGD